MNTGFFYLVDRDAKQVVSAGELPESWGNIPSLNQLNYETISDLTWAGFPQYGFLTEEDARAVHDMDQASVDAAKKGLYDTIWEEIKIERDRRKAGGVLVPVDGKDFWFWTDEPTRTQYALLINFVERNKLTETDVLDSWKTMSGEYTDMTVALLHKVLDAGIAKERQLFNFAKQLNLKLYASNDPVGLDWKSGWPEIYEEYAARIATQSA